MILVASWGEILRPEFLALPRFAVLNVHPSLLPRHRGATPVQAAILAGDTHTGVTIQRVTTELDAGDLLVEKSVEIAPAETAGELLGRLALLGGEAAAEALDSIEDGTAVFRPQDASRATFCKRLTKESGRIDWRLPAEELERHVRAMDPWPAAYTTLPNGVPLTIWKARALPEPAAAPGTVVDARDRLRVACGSGSLELLEVQSAGRRAMTAAEFLRGARLAPGERLGV